MQLAFLLLMRMNLRRILMWMPLAPAKGCSIIALAFSFHTSLPSVPLFSPMPLLLSVTHFTVPFPALPAFTSVCTHAPSGSVSPLVSSSSLQQDLLGETLDQPQHSEDVFKEMNGKGCVYVSMSHWMILDLRSHQLIPEKRGSVDVMLWTTTCKKLMICRVMLSSRRYRTEADELVMGQSFFSWGSLGITYLLKVKYCLMWLEVRIDGKRQWPTLLVVYMWFVKWSHASLQMFTIVLNFQWWDCQKWMKYSLMWQIKKICCLKSMIQTWTYSREQKAQLPMSYSINALSTCCPLLSSSLWWKTVHSHLRRELWARIFWLARWVAFIGSHLVNTSLVCQLCSNAFQKGCCFLGCCPLFGFDFWFLSQVSLIQDLCQVWINKYCVNHSAKHKSEVSFGLSMGEKNKKKETDIEKVMKKVTKEEEGEKWVRLDGWVKHGIPQLGTCRMSSFIWLGTLIIFR